MHAAEFISHWFRICANCGSVRPKFLTPLCDSCWRLARLDQSSRVFFRWVDGQSASGSSLFDWIPGKNDALSALLVSLKGQKSLGMMQLLSAQLLQRRASNADSFPTNSILIPAPSSRPKTRDHALGLAEALSFQLDMPVSNCLVKVRGTKQRGKLRSQRKGRNVRWAENFSPSHVRGKHVIFVDDVVTTGSTAIHAKSTLNAKSFEILCVAQRVLPCDARGSLL